MKESVIEAYLREQVKQAGGRAYKFVSPGNDGVPDRLVCFPHGQAYFVELKAPGKKPRPLQVIQIKRLRDLGFSVYVIDCKESVDRLLNHLQQKIG